MRANVKVMLAALAIGAAFWVLDAGIDTCFFYDKGFTELLATDVPRIEVYMRCAVLLMCVGCGTIVTWLAARRERAESALRVSEERYRRIVETAQEGICLLDEAGKLTYVNSRLTQMLGYCEEELRGKGLFDFVDHADDGEREQFLGQTTDAMRTERGFRFRRQDGSAVWALMSASRMTDDSGRFLGALAVLSDVTKLTLAEQSLREQEADRRRLSEKLMNLHEAANDLSRSSTADDLCRRAVELGRSRLGFDRLSIWFVDDRGQFVVGSYGTDEEGQLRDERQHRVALAPGSAMEQALAHRASTQVWHDTPLQDDHGTVIGHGEKALAALWNGEQIIGLLAADNLLKGEPIGDREQELLTLFASTIGHLFSLKRMEEQNRALLNGIPDLMFRMRADGTFLDFRGEQDELVMPADEIIGSNIAEAPMPESVKTDLTRLIRLAVESGEAQQYEYDLPMPRGAQLYEARIEKSGSDEAVAIVRNVTELRRLEQQLREKTKMEAVGVLAGGIAHDFNNLLQSIVGYSHLLLKRIDDPTAKHDLTVIRRQADRGAGLVRHLLGFARRQILQPRVIDVNQLAQGFSETIRRLIGEDIEVEFRPAHEAVRLSADPNQIEQVLMNLALNARDAMPQGGALAIEVSSVELDEWQAAGMMDLAPGSYAVLRIADTGSGIDQGAMAHIFDPFFTTKEVGKGSGLGLSSAYGIVQQHHGTIAVESEPGKGSTFRIYLPSAPVAEPETPEREAPAHGPGGSETVLVVEDDQPVLRVVERILSDQGYTVLRSDSTEEAERIFAEHASEVAILITDVLMPRMSGRQLYEGLLQQDPSLRVLYMSGHHADLLGEQGVDESAANFIRKPFDTGDLAQKVRQVLDE